MVCNVSRNCGLLWSMVVQSDLLALWLALWLVLLHICCHTGAVRTVGFPAIYRAKIDSVRGALIIPDPTVHILNDGWVVGWHTWVARGKRTQRAHLQIWRPVNTARNQYSFIGQTIVDALRAEYNYYGLNTESNRIYVLAGDVIGIYFPKYNPIPWTAVTCANGSEHLYNYNPKRQQVGKSLVLEQASDASTKPCRHYSLNATIINDEELESYELVTYPNHGLLGAWLPEDDSGAAVFELHKAYLFFCCLLSHLISTIFTTNT